MSVRGVIRSLERLQSLEPIADWGARTVGSVLRRGPLPGILSGSWLGHPLHPALTDVPVGALTAATFLELIGGEGADATVDGLIVLGLVSVAPAAVTGLSDWSDTVDRDRRIGLLHAAANTGGTLMYLAALLSRRAGARGTGRAFCLLGLGAISAGGYLGGDLVFGRGIGVDHTVFDEAPTGWTRVARAVDVPERTPTGAGAGAYRVLLYRDGDALFALADRCTHAGGPLSEGEVDAELCVTCPWHGSRFRLRDGAVVNGPASAPQPVLEARVKGGHIEVREAPV